MVVLGPVVALHITVTDVILRNEVTLAFANADGSLVDV